ncbi:UbiA prenyltransferase [Leucogyrophana mollusca]|uniref:UbiA prenyltransferase n=1 Tax=Leucogyrophana mollusca TaxID=85980 RepID=A0ACB8B962_9AGAM|nr:UbiA prenyltransferase [Leucogyrophana mollusca]
MSVVRGLYELARFHIFPSGITPIFCSCAWGLTMAAYRGGLPPSSLARDIVTYFLVSTLVHGANCVLNDILDRDIDRQEFLRTKNRPVAAGVISVFAAIVYMFALLAPCLLLLAYTDPLTFKLGLFGVFPLQALYPTMKRITNWPQLWLGLAMNWGCPVAWVYLLGNVDLRVPAALFVGSVCWTIVYDTIYACQDRKEDAKLRVGSTAVLFGNQLRPILAIFATVFVASLAYAGILNSQKLPYFLISVGGAAAHLGWQIGTLNPDDAKDCWKKFEAGGNLGYIVWGGMIADYVGLF